jgi:hypothetical protein
MKIKTGGLWHEKPTDESFDLTSRNDFRDDNGSNSRLHNHTDRPFFRHHDLGKTHRHASHADHGRDHLPEVGVKFRAIDGANNNSSDPGFNATNTDFARIGEVCRWNLVTG